MQRIGVIFGMEETFPPALVERINPLGGRTCTAEFVEVGAVRMDEPARYRVIVDRISHDIPFYRAYLKNAVLAGTTVINNPFWWSADDKFFNYALATAARRGDAADGAAAAQAASARHDRSVDAQPAVPARLGRRVRVRRLPGVPEAVRRRRLEGRLQGRTRRRSSSPPTTNAQALHDAAARRATSTNTSAATSSARSRCASCRTTRARRSTSATSRTRRRTIAALLARVERDAITLCRALGYDLNTVEFAVEDGVPYAIDFMNPAPDADRALGRRGQLRRGSSRPWRSSPSEKRSTPPRAPVELRWQRLLNALRWTPMTTALLHDSASRRNTRRSIPTRSICDRTSRPRSSRRASGR